MDQAKNLVGMRFEKLLVISRASSNRQRQATWTCICDCGGFSTVSGTNLLRRGTNTKSCGCLKMGGPGKLKPYEWMLARMKGSAKLRELEFTLTYADILKFVKLNRCHYCKATIAWYPRKTNEVTPKYYIDRKNSQFGYLAENCVVCCTRCNRGKSNSFTYDEWWRMTECFRREHEDQRSIGGITEGTGIESTGASD